MKRILALFLILISINLVIALEIDSPGTYEVSIGDTINLNQIPFPSTIVEITDLEGNPTIFISGEDHEEVLNEGQYTEIIQNIFGITEIIGIKVEFIDVDSKRASITITDLLNLPPVPEDAPSTFDMRYIWVGIVVVVISIIIYLLLRKKKRRLPQ